ncbi:hypothetical protein Pelo_15924 [Pelomyxa schiedti]|nr:hypothetical protein Pelo_15924 [Pelomyxa schiedti]
MGWAWCVVQREESACVDLKEDLSGSGYSTCGRFTRKHGLELSVSFLFQVSFSLFFSFTVLSKASDDIVIHIHLLLTGPKRSGITCFQRRFEDDIYDPDPITTIGVSFKLVTREVGQYRLQILDIPAPFLRGPCFIRADVLLLCFDLNDPKSFTEASERILPHIMANGIHPLRVVLIGCKSDLVHNVSKEAINALCKSHANLTYYETSARLSTGIEQPVLDSCAKILEPIKSPKAITRLQKQPPTPPSACSLL